MYRIEIVDGGYEVLVELIKYCAKKLVDKMNENDPEDVAAFLGCMMLLDNLKGAKHINDE